MLLLSVLPLFLLLLGLIALCLTDNTLMMLYPHVVYLHISKVSKCKTLFKCMTRMVGMHMYLNYIIKRYTYYRVTYRLEEALQIILLSLAIWLLKIDNKLCTISKLYIRCGYEIVACACGCSCHIHCSSVLAEFNCNSAHETVDSTLEHHHESLST